MKVVMPEVAKPLQIKELKNLAPYLARNTDTDNIKTLIRVNNSVLFIGEHGLTQGTVEYALSGYEIIREYTAGDTLTLSV